MYPLKDAPLEDQVQEAQYVPSHELQPLTLTVDKKINHMMRYFDFNTSSANQRKVF